MEFENTKSDSFAGSKDRKERTEKKIYKKEPILLWISYIYYIKRNLVEDFTNAAVSPLF